MGDVIRLFDRRPPAGSTRADPARVRATIYFDLASPLTYLAAERADRLFGGLSWRPVFGEPIEDMPNTLAVEERAVALRMPLVWPERWPRSVRPAMRVAARAAERGRAAPFVLAASRLAYCGGFDLDDPEVLAEAAAAANLGLDDALRAAGDPTRDAAMELEARRLAALGATALPAIRVGRVLICGEHRLGEAAAAARARAEARPRRVG